MVEGTLAGWSQGVPQSHTTQQIPPERFSGDGDVQRWPLSEQKVKERDEKVLASIRGCGTCSQGHEAVGQCCSLVAEADMFYCDLVSEGRQVDMPEC